MSEVMVDNNQVVAKARLVANISPDRVVIPDLRNDIDENGLTLNPGDKIDLTQYYTATEINRSRGLDNCIQGKKNPEDDTWVVKPCLIILETIDQVLPKIPKPFAKEQTAGSSFEASRNFADDNLDKLDEQEQKEFEKIQARNGRRPK